MRNFTSLKTGINSFFLVLFSVLSFNVFAEGTPTVSPNSTTISGLLLAPDINSGAYFNAAEDNKLKFVIDNATTENLYFGFDAYNFVAAGSTRLSNAVGFKLFWRIMRNVAGTPTVQASGQWNATGATDNGEILNYTQAVNGPNINGVTTGYVPITFDPTVAGEYWIEIFRGTDVNTPSVTANDRGTLPLFDFTVASGPAATATKIPGRIYSGKWGMVAMSSTNTIVVTSNAAPVFYAYTADLTLVKIEFQTGFQPISFDVAVNSYGVSTTGTWDVTRRSVNNATTPSLINGYKVFLNTPDVSLFPIGPIPANPAFLSPAVTGCGPYILNFNIQAPGDVKILLDLNGVAGYQAATSDRVLEAFGLALGNNTISWDGKDGLGTNVASGTSLNLALTYAKGRFNLPLQDAEINSNGLKISIIQPVPIANAQIYWDDTQVVNTASVACGSAADNQNNITGSGFANNPAIGTTSPGHAWSGNGNAAQTIPAPVVAGNDVDTFQCSDFGNVRTINTWGWGFTSSVVNLNLVFGCSDLQITKTINNSSPKYGSQVIFTLTALNNGTGDSVSTQVNDLLPTGYTYVSDNGGGAYNSASGVWTIGNLANGASTSIQITASVKGTGNYNNSASVSGALTDPNSANNTSSVSSTPTCNATIAPSLNKN
ncbi:DUF11 domain-containing protein [Flavobacterium sp. SUN052]|uniref:DUF11 domain-containing protein n=1 Tax=Flavobacterium sp. SUN052 TaxID=3002441 RepID=UPI00237DB79D|nr:DUF11 domain-containing protein [Flavobacterium sp. SUN052]MEC4003026.1 DUF11 domain-containing protein [Flavobacterium sp. SUN052]